MSKKREVKGKVITPSGKEVHFCENAVSEEEALLILMFRAEREGNASEIAEETDEMPKKGENGEERVICTLKHRYKVQCSFE